MPFPLLIEYLENTSTNDVNHVEVPTMKSTTLPMEDMMGEY